MKAKDPISYLDNHYYLKCLMISKYIINNSVNDFTIFDSSKFYFNLLQKIIIY